MHAPVYIIDPGHGGAEPQGRSSAIGAVGPGGTREKDVNLALARSIAQHLGPEAVLTRAGDVNLSLGARAQLARDAGAPVFLSIHANQGAAGQGSELYVHEEASDASLVLATSIGRELSAFGGAQRGVIGAGPLAVLSPAVHGSRTAACLIEADDLSRPEGEARLRDPRAVDELARAVAHGVRRYREAEVYGGPRPSCSSADRSLPYDYSFTITSQIFTYSFQSGGTVNLSITAQLTSGFSPRPGPDVWPPIVQITLERCSAGVFTTDRTVVGSASCAADRTPRSFSFTVDPGVYYFRFRTRSSWQVMGWGTIS